MASLFEPFQLQLTGLSTSLSDKQILPLLDSIQHNSIPAFANGSPPVSINYRFHRSSIQFDSLPTLQSLPSSFNYLIVHLALQETSLTVLRLHHSPLQFNSVQFNSNPTLHWFRWRFPLLPMNNEFIPPVSHQIARNSPTFSLPRKIFPIQTITSTEKRQSLTRLHFVSLHLSIPFSHSCHQSILTDFEMISSGR